MNKETQEVVNHIDASGYYLDKIAKLKSRFTNIKDFQNQLGYVVMEVVNTERRFINMNRRNLDIEAITNKYF